MNTYQTQVTTSSKVGEGFPLPPFVLVKPFVKGRRGRRPLRCIVNTPLCHLERRRNPRRSEALTKTPRACRSVNGKDLCETVYARPPNISNIMFGFSLALIHRRFRSLPRAFFSLNTVEKSSTSCRNIANLLDLCLSSALRSE